MIKIPTMYERDETQKGHPVKPVLKPECAWVEAGEGIPTRKIDGTNVRVACGCLLKRQKPKDRDYDNTSYVSCSRECPSDKWLWESFDNSGGVTLPDGIYEAVGPKIQGNPERCEHHVLVRVVPLNSLLYLTAEGLRLPDFAGLWGYLGEVQIEGVVFHHPDGRMAKIKRRDFGYRDRTGEVPRIGTGDT